MKATIEQIGNGKPALGSRIRRFFEGLLTSRHVRFLESELIRVRAEKDSVIAQLREEKRELQVKIEKLELSVWPLASRAGAAFVQRQQPKDSPRPPLELPPTKFSEALAQHMKIIEQEEKSEAPKEN